MRIKILGILFAILANTAIGGIAAAAMGFNPVAGVIILNTIAGIMSFVPMPSGLRAGVYVEVWTGKIVEHFTHVENGTFLDGVPDFSRHVDNNVIHLVDVTGDPTVLIDNTTYPLTIEDLGDGDVAIKLHKFETLPTRVTDDELYALSYDKIEVAKERHGNKLGEAHLDKAIHAFAPSTDTAETPVIFTSGAADETGRLCLMRKDVLALKRKADGLKIPKKGRRLVLCSDHVNDLLEEDQKFKDQYHNYESGMIYKMYGFEIYEASNCPIFGQDKKKASYGAIPIEGQAEASVFFYVPRMFKCKGSTDMYYSEAKKDPVNKQNLVSFTNRFVALPQKREGATGAIISKFEE